MLELIFIAVAVFVRLITLAISMRNERNLLDGGAVEHGGKTSMAIAASHVVFYLGAIAECVWRDAPFTWINGFGLVMYVMSICALLWVIVRLGRLWTVKIYVAPDHTLETSWLFRRIRHPNYFLNIIPELIGFALVLNAWTTLVIALPIYLVIFSMRIFQEERIMRQTFTYY